MWTWMIGLPLCGVGAPSIGPVHTDSVSVACGERHELTFAVSGRFDNPFDPREIAVDATFEGPDGARVAMPGFLCQAAQRRLVDGTEQVELVGEPTWKVRWTPTRPGPWRGVVTATDVDGAATSAPIEVMATPGAGPGFIRLRPGSRYFEYADGTPLFLFGHNIAWAHAGGTYDFDRWLPPLAAAGGNLARIWLQWNRVLSIEYKGERSGCGRYDLANAWRVDYVLDRCRELGVHVLFTLDSPEPYQKEHYWLGKLTARPWDDFCAHNAANGGTLAEPEEFYTTPEGRRLIRQRLRYIVARWGWDPNLLCWELWNELNCFPGWQDLLPQIVDWHREMAAFVRQLDPYDHIITTSFGNAYGEAAIWELPEIEFTHSHVYQSTDLAGDYPQASTEMLRRYGKPHLVGEFGPKFDQLARLREIDPEGLHVHNELWASVMVGDAGTALSWCWEYLADCGVERHYTPLRRFAEGVPWTTAGFAPARLRFEWAPGVPPGPDRDLVLPCGVSAGAPVGETIAIDPHDPPRSLQRFYLYGRAQAEQQKPRVLELEYSQPGQVILNIGRVWVHGILEMSLDGEPLPTVDLPAGEGAGPWKHSELDPRWNIWGADYDKDITVEIPAGRHRLSLYNAGRDGITIDRITLTRYRRGDRPFLRAFGLRGERLALLWAQNPESCLQSLLDGRSPTPVTGARLVLEEIPTGPCRVEWWDTWTGQVIRAEQVSTEAGRLTLDLPELTRDIALKASW